MARLDVGRQRVERFAASPRYIGSVASWLDVGRKQRKRRDSVSKTQQRLPREVAEFHERRQHVGNRPDVEKQTRRKVAGQVAGLDERPKQADTRQVQPAGGDRSLHDVRVDR